MTRRSAGSCHNVSAQITGPMRALLRPASLVAAILVLFSTLMWTDSALAITAPELRGQRAVQEITADMHGLDLKEKEFLKADLRDVNLSGTDLRGAGSTHPSCRGLICVVPTSRMWWGSPVALMEPTCEVQPSPTRC